jgi:type IV pilus assembly PilO-like protein
MSLTDRDRKIAILLVPVILIAAYWFLVLSPKRKEATKLSGQVAQAQQARDAAVSTANSLEQAKAAFSAQYAQMVRLGKAIPTQVDMPSLLVQLQSAAHGTGIQFADVKVGARVAAAPVSTPTTGTTGTSTSTSSSTSTGTTGASGSTPPPVAAGGAQAQTTFGKDAEAANNAAAQGNAQAVQQSGLSAGDASTSTATKSGGLPVGGGGSVAASAATVTPGAPVPGLDSVPLTFTFGGKFGNLAQFFHRLKRFVHVANNKINVQGRLITIDSLKFTSSAQNFPFIEADVSATVYLSPQDGGTTAGATSSGPATSTPGTTPASSSASSNASAAASAVTPPTSAITR